MPANPGAVEVFQKDTGNILYEEICLHLLDNPNTGELTQSAKTEHVMGLKTNEGIQSKTSKHPAGKAPAHGIRVDSITSATLSTQYMLVSE